MCQEEIGSVCLVSPSSLPLTLHLSAPYMALFLIHSPAQQKGYKKKREASTSETPLLQSGSCITSSVARSSSSKSWWMGDGYLPDQFGITAGVLQVLEMMMQRYLNAKSAQVNQARAAGISPEGWEGGGGRTLNHHAEYFTLRGAGNPTAPVWSSACPRRQPGLGYGEFILQQPGARK